MAITSSFIKEIKLGTKRAKLYKVTKDASTTTCDITPGAGFTEILGNYTKYTVASGVFTITFPAGSTNGAYVNFLFIAP
jgi:hypothetical protein